MWSGGHDGARKALQSELADLGHISYGPIDDQAAEIPLDSGAGHNAAPDRGVLEPARVDNKNLAGTRHGDGDMGGGIASRHTGHCSGLAQKLHAFRDG
jgi:hypothetical protein